MMRLLSAIAVIVALTSAIVATACGSEENEVDTDRIQDQARAAGSEMQQQARKAYADLSTDGERFVDRVQTGKDAGAKQALLDTCRDAEEKLKKSGDASRGDDVDELCDSIREADVNDLPMWNEIKSRLTELQNSAGG